MYYSHFGFAEPPFNITSNPRFYYRNAAHDEIISVVRHAIELRKGVTVVKGEPGTGKTLLLKFLMQTLEPRVGTVTVRNPHADFAELLRFLVRQLGIEDNEQDSMALLERLSVHLKEQRREGRLVALLIDEAQKMSEQTFDDLRLLSDLEFENEALLPIVLIGQPELNAKLEQPSVRRLRQCVALTRQIYPLTRNEIEPYIDYRIRLSGFHGQRLFDADALTMIANVSKGVPRTINVICDNALLTAYLAKQKLVSSGIVDRAVRDLGLANSGQRERDFQRGEPDGRRLAHGTTPVQAAADLRQTLPLRAPILLTETMEFPDRDFGARASFFPRMPSRYESLIADRLYERLDQSLGALRSFQSSLMKTIGENTQRHLPVLKTLPVWENVRENIIPGRLRWLGIAAGAVLLLLTIGSIVRSKPISELEPIGAGIDELRTALRPVATGTAWKGAAMVAPARRAPTKPRAAEPAGMEPESNRLAKIEPPQNPSPTRDETQTALKPEGEKTARRSSADVSTSVGRRIILQVVAPSLLRNEPSAEAKIIGALEPGSQVRVHGTIQDYFKVSSIDDEPLRGFVHREDAFFESRKN